MYMLIRLIIGCIFLFVSILLIQKSKVVRKSVLYVFFTTISLVLVVVLALFPFENFWVTFDSPEEAYEYINLGRVNIELIVQGKNSAFVIDNKNDSDTYLIIPKTTEGWRIGIGSDTKKIVQKISDGVVICVYQYKDTKDYYITIFDTDGGESKIVDSLNSKFFTLRRSNDVLGKTFVTYYTQVSELDSQYYLIVNNKKISPIT